MRCCHCERPLGRVSAKCPTCLTSQPWWNLTALVFFLLSLIWLTVYGIPMLAE